MKGDINQDGKITEEDVIELKKIIAGTNESELVEKIADINGDGKINSKDVAALKRIIKSLSEGE